MEEIAYVMAMFGVDSVITWIILGLVLSSIFIEISPIKINPLSRILKYIGNCMFSDVNCRLNEIEKQMDENEIDHIRWEILNFANSCRHNRNPGKDEFEHVIAQNAKYKKLIEKHKITNDVYTEEYKFILELYHEYQYGKLESHK